MQGDAGTDFGLIGGREPDATVVTTRRRWMALLIVLPMLVGAGLLFTGGDRLERSDAPMPGFEIQTTSSAPSFTADLSSGWSSAQLDTWGAFVGIAEYAGSFIAVEQSPYGSLFWRSADGSTWDLAADASAVFENASVESIARIDDRWVATGSNRVERTWGQVPAIWYSTDGEQWSQSDELPWGVTAGIDGYQGGTVLTLAETSSGLLLAGGASNNGATIWTSADSGNTWQLAFREGVYSTVRAFAEVADGYLAIGDRSLRATTWRSMDGINWVRGDTTALPVAGSREYPWDVLDLEDGWVAVGGLAATRFHEPSQEEVDRPPVLWSSTDGETWDRDLLDGLVGVDFAQSLVLRGRIVVVGSRSLEGGREAGIWWSEDGRRWEGSMLGPASSAESRIHGIAASGNRLVAVGQSDSGPCVWVWDVDGPVAIETSHRPEFAVGRWVDQGVVSDEWLWDISHTEHGLIASSERGLLVSVDGREWRRRSFEELGIPQTAWISSLPSGSPPYYMALRSESDRWWVARSLDGESWQVAWDEAERWNFGGFVATGDSGVMLATEGPDGRSLLFSPDGETWEPISPPLDQFIGGIFGFGERFLVSMAPDWGVAGTLWIYTPPGDWEEISEFRVVDASGLDSFTVDGEFYLFQRWAWEQERGLWATTDGVAWQQVELPAMVGNSDVSIEPTAAGLLLIEMVWDEHESWPARIWIRPPEGRWVELPPIGVAGAAVVPIPGADTPLLLSVDGFEQTRLWEWVEG